MTPTIKPDPEHVADACVAAARINHYLVGLAVAVDRDTASQAKQILIERENACAISEEEADLALLVLCNGCGVRSEGEL